MDYTRTIALPLVSAAAQVFKLRTGAGAGVFRNLWSLPSNPKPCNLKRAWLKGFFELGIRRPKRWPQDLLTRFRLRASGFGFRMWTQVAICKYEKVSTMRINMLRSIYAGEPSFGKPSSGLMSPRSRAC